MITRALLLLLFISLPANGYALSSQCKQALGLAKKGMSMHDPSQPLYLKQAMLHYEKALKLCPELCRSAPQVCANLGNAYYHFQKPDEAITMYRTALRWHGDYSTPYFGLGQIYLDRGELGFALDNFLKAYNLDRSDAEARSEAAKAFGKVCDQYTKAQGDRAEVDLGQVMARSNMENRMLMDKHFHETNRRLFHCEQKSFRVEFVLRNISFETARAVLKPEADEQIGVVGSILTDNPDMKIILEGHTDLDPFGSRKEVKPGVRCKDNMCLSQARAESVKEAIVERYGVDPNRIRVEAFGDSMPLIPERSPEANAQNRRVTMVMDQERD